MDTELRVENDLYLGSDGRRAFYDLHIPENFNGRLVIFIHGYKGFKDWGAWNLVDFEFTYSGFGFAKFNLTHNGGNEIYARDFPDLDAFSRNTYSKEVNDLRFFLDHLDTLNLPEHSKHLIGHSRGGGIGLIAVSEDPRISSICTWSSISNIAKRMPQGENLELWKTTGVRFELNTRTSQEMPILYSLYEDFLKNTTRLNIELACKKIKIPRLLIHGSNDESVSFEEGLELSEWLDVPIIEIPDCNHTFGSQHPMNSYKLPRELKTVVDLTKRFIGDL